MKYLLLISIFLLASQICIAQTDHFKEIMKLAIKGDAIAQNDIGDLLYDGKEGVSVNYEESVIWYKKRL